MKPPIIACIVEGHGEVDSVPVLIERIARRHDPSRGVRVVPPLRTPRNRFTQRPEEMRRMVELAVRLQGGGPGGVLILMDADRDLPCQFGPTLQDRAASIRPDRSIRVVLAVAEFEAWFLAAARSLTKEGLPADIMAPPAPEAIRDAKGWLDARLRQSRGSGYAETVDQPRFSRTFDLDAALTTRSFAKLYKETVRLLTR